MPKLYTLFHYLNHRLHSRRWNSFHSPHLYELFSYCGNDKNNFTDFNSIEAQRKLLIKSDIKIRRTDFGTGSSDTENNKYHFISGIARKSLSFPYQCRFLYRLMNWIQPDNVIEFGTSLGIATAYLALGARPGHVLTIEGDPLLVQQAERVLKNLGIGNVSVFNMTFEDFIKIEPAKIGMVDFAFLDGHHTSASLISQYQTLLEHIGQKSIIMIDDIYWSKDMNDGWNELITRPEVTQSVDCFQFGLLFFNPDFLEKENHFIHLPLRAYRSRSN